MPDGNPRIRICDYEHVSGGSRVGIVDGRGFGEGLVGVGAGDDLGLGEERFSASSEPLPILGTNPTSLARLGTEGNEDANLHQTPPRATEASSRT
jgi:hypothetical protein